MDEITYYKLKADILPAVTLLDVVTINPPYIHFRRQAKEYILYYILSGEMHLMEDGKPYILKPDDFMVLDPSHEHVGIKSTKCQFFYIHFHHSKMEELSDKIPQLKEYLTANRISSLKTIDIQLNTAEAFTCPDLFLPKYYHINPSATAVNLVDKLYLMRESLHSPLEYNKLKASCMLIEFFITLSRELTSDLVLHDNTVTTTRSIRIIHDLLSFFQSSFGTEISASSLEEKYGYSFDYINRIFKKAIGTTIFVYLNELRITRAKQLLSNGICSTAEVAEKTGFSDVYYFSKVFKKYTGMTPGAYLKSTDTQ